MERTILLKSLVSKVSKNLARYENNVVWIIKTISRTFKLTKVLKFFVCHWRFKRST